MIKIKNAYTVVTMFTMRTRKNAYMVVTRGSITTSVPVAATAVRTGRGSVANSGSRPVWGTLSWKEEENEWKTLRNFQKHYETFIQLANNQRDKQANKETLSSLWTPAGTDVWSQQLMNDIHQLTCVIPCVGTEATKATEAIREIPTFNYYLRMKTNVNFYVSFKGHLK